MPVFFVCVLVIFFFMFFFVVAFFSCLTGVFRVFFSCFPRSVVFFSMCVFCDVCLVSALSCPRSQSFLFIFFSCFFCVWCVCFFVFLSCSYRHDTCFLVDLLFSEFLALWCVSECTRNFCTQQLCPVFCCFQ